MELYFFQNCYVGVSAIENGATNVCGLAPERTLRSFSFHPSDLLARCAPLSDRLRPLTRTMDWLVSGPLVFSEWFSQPADQTFYRAGDSLGFIDPFTGSGILNAMLTGELAGVASRPLRIRRVISSRLPAPAPARIPRLFRIPRDHRLRPSRCPRPPGPRAISLSRHPPSRAPGPVSPRCRAAHGEVNSVRASPAHSTLLCVSSRRI